MPEPLGCCQPGVALRPAVRTCAHLPREVAVPVEVHVLVLFAVHAQADLERFPVRVEAELQFTQAVEEFGQVAAHLVWEGKHRILHPRAVRRDPTILVFLGQF